MTSLSARAFICIGTRNKVRSSSHQFALTSRGVAWLSAITQRGRVGLIIAFLVHPRSNLWCVLHVFRSRRAPVIKTIGKRAYAHTRPSVCPRKQSIKISAGRNLNLICCVRSGRMSACYRAQPLPRETQSAWHRSARFPNPCQDNREKETKRGLRATRCCAVAS